MISSLITAPEKGQNAPSPHVLASREGGVGSFPNFSWGIHGQTLELGRPFPKKIRFLPTLLTSSPRPGKAEEAHQDFRNWPPAAAHLCPPPGTPHKQEQQQPMRCTSHSNISSNLSNGVKQT